MKPLLRNCLLLIAAGSLSSHAAEGVVSPGAKLQTLAAEFKFTEGPTADAAGNVFFTDQPNDRIMRWGIDGKLTTFLQPAGRANGMCFDAKGRLLACADEKTELWIFDSPPLTAAPQPPPHRVVISQYQGTKLNGPNDVWCHPNGSLYFTDPFYKRPWWDYDKPPQGGQHVYRLDADMKTLRRVAEDLKQPNGIVGSPDGKLLYVSDIGDRKTYRYSILSDGTLSGKHLHCELGSDGMTLDAEGNLYLTGRGVSVFNSKGEKIDQIDVPENWTANACFGGPDRKTLFITASKGLYSIQTRTGGASKQGK